MHSKLASDHCPIVAFLASDFAQNSITLTTATEGMLPDRLIPIRSRHGETTSGRDWV